MCGKAPARGMFSFSLCGAGFICSWAQVTVVCLLSNVRGVTTSQGVQLTHLFCKEPFRELMVMYARS